MSAYTTTKSDAFARANAALWSSIQLLFEAANDLASRDLRVAIERALGVSASHLGHLGHFIQDDQFPVVTRLDECLLAVGIIFEGMKKTGSEHEKNFRKQYRDVQNLVHTQRGLFTEQD